MIFENEEARIPTMGEIFTPMIVIYILASVFVFVSYKISIGDSRLDFINWVGYIYEKDIHNTLPMLFIFLMFIFVPILITFLKFNERKDKILKRKTTNQLLYIDISQGSIYFSFNNRDLNFECLYSDVKDMTLTIVTDYSKKGSSYRNRHGAYGRTRNGFRKLFNGAII